MTTNLGKHDFIIITTKAAVPAGAVVITISGLTMGPIMERREDGFKVNDRFCSNFSTHINIFNSSHESGQPGRHSRR